MIEVKADALEASFEAVENAGLPPVRPMLAGGRPLGSAAFEGFLRAGSGGVEMKAMSGASDAAGGYAVPEEIDARDRRDAESGLAHSRDRQCREGGIERISQAGDERRHRVGLGGGDRRRATETATPTFNEVAPPSGDLYANPAASQAMLDDAAFDVEEWLAQEIAREFAAAEGSAFVNGNGTNKPRGFLATATASTGRCDAGVRDAAIYRRAARRGRSRPIREEKLIDLVQSLRTPYRQGASWVMNSATLARIRKFKTIDGAFLWAPSLAVGQPATLLGYPVVEAEDMPDIAANALSIAFGNFKAGYLIAERGETQVLRDPYSNKPFVHFYATKRVGGMVSNSEAIKLLKFAAS